MPTPASERTFDVILIGSGIGALTCAALLAKLAGKRVLVLERHFKPGGYTHVFRRRGDYQWNPGLHYVGDMKPGSNARAMCDFITGGASGSASRTPSMPSFFPISPFAGAAARRISSGIRSPAFPKNPSPSSAISGT